MNELMVHVERAVRPVRAGPARKLKMRQELLAHLSGIYDEFNWSTDIRAARQTVQERLSRLEGTLPAVARPQMAPTTSIMGQIVVAGATRRLVGDLFRLTDLGRQTAKVLLTEKGFPLLFKFGYAR